MKRSELALKNFMEGYNCCQSVVLAYKDLLDIDEKTLARLTSGFGGGMGRLRETCGAITAVFMILSLLYGYDDNDTDIKKAELYSRVQELGLKFEKENGSLVCRELLSLKDKHSNSIPTARNQDFYKTRPCVRIIASASEILEEYLDKK